MVKKAALVFGAVYLLVGILGFIPGVSSTNSDGMKMLLGIFMVGTLHNIIHLAVGLLGVAMSRTFANARLYFKLIGVVYGLIAIIGFIQGDTVLGLIDINTADNLLHTASALVALYFGFGPVADETQPAKA